MHEFQLRNFSFKALVQSVVCILWVQSSDTSWVTSTVLMNLNKAWTLICYYAFWKNTCIISMIYLYLKAKMQNSLTEHGPWDHYVINCLVEVWWRCISSLNYVLMVKVTMTSLCLLQKQDIRFCVMTNRQDLVWKCYVCNTT